MGHKPKGTTSALIFIPDPLHLKASALVRYIKENEQPTYSLQQMMIDALREYIEKRSPKG